MELVKEKKALLLGIDVGCGERKVKIDGYQMVSCDIRGEVHPDMICPIDAIPIPSESYDLVFASHVLEHVKRADIYKTMKEWRRILKVGGKLQLIVPDLEVAAIELLSCKTSNDTFDILFGAQNYPTNFHFSGYTHMLLQAIVKNYGFEVNIVECKNREIYLTATKSGEEYM